MDKNKFNNKNIITAVHSPNHSFINLNLSQNLPNNLNIKNYNKKMICNLRSQFSEITKKNPKLIITIIIVKLSKKIFRTKTLKVNHQIK